MPDNSDKKFLKYKARILAINGGTPSDPRLPYDIHVGAFRGYTDGETISAGTPLMDIIRKEFESTPVSYTISISSTGPGTVSPTGSQSVIRGGSLTVTATPNAGSQIKTFKVDGASQTSPYVFTNVQTNHTVVVEFEPIPVTAHTIVASAGTGGTITPSGNVTVADGGNQTFTIAANSGYEIDDVKVDGASQGAIATYTFSNVVADHTIEATFKVSPTPVVTHKITVSAGANGSISPAGPEVIVNDGASQTFTITPNTDYEVDTLTVDGSVVTAATSYTFNNVTADHTIDVTFKAVPVVIDTYTVNVTNNTPTFGTITPASGTVNVGTITTVTATPNSGYKIKTLTLDGADKTSPFTINGVKDQTYNVVVEFEPETSKKLYIGHIVGSRGATVVPTSSNITIVTSEEKTDAELRALKASGWTVTHPARNTFSEYFVAYPAEMGALRAVTSVAAQLPDAYETETFDINGVSCIVAYHPGCNKSGGEIKYEW